MAQSVSTKQAISCQLASIVLEHLKQGDIQGQALLPYIESTNRRCLTSTRPVCDLVATNLCTSQRVCPRQLVHVSDDDAVLYTEA